MRRVGASVPRVSLAQDRVGRDREAEQNARRDVARVRDDVNVGLSMWFCEDAVVNHLAERNDSALARLRFEARFVAGVACGRVFHLGFCRRYLGFC